MTLFLALFALHPFSIELFWCSETALQMVSSIWLGAVGLCLAVSIDRPVKAGLIGIILLVAAHAIYQTAMAYLLAACCLGFAALIVRDAASLTLFRSRLARVAVVIALSAPAYLATVRLVFVWPLGKPWARAGLFAQASLDRLLNATESEARSAEEYCPSVDSWPAKESAILMGNVAVVCLP